MGIFTTRGAGAMPVLALIVCGWSCAASARLTTPELGAYQATTTRSQQSEGSIQYIVEVLANAQTAQQIARAGAALSQRWNISKDAAEALIELVVLTRTDADSHRLRATVTRVTAGAPNSRDAWRVVLWHLQQTGGCDDAELRSRYFHSAGASLDFLRSDDGSCASWLYSLPRFAAATPALYARVARENDVGAIKDDAGRLTAARTFRDLLRQAQVPFNTPERLYAERHFWTLLLNQGLGEQLRSEAQALSPEDLVVLLNGESPGAVSFDGHELENEIAGREVAQQIQIGWILMLLEHADRGEARRWLERWKSADKRQQNSTPRQILLRIAQDSKADIFDLLMQADGPNGGLDGSVFDSPAGRAVVVRYLMQHSNHELAAYLRSRPCSNAVTDRDTNDWTAFPDEFRKSQLQFALEIDATRRSQSDCSRQSDDTGVDAAARTVREIALPIALRSRHDSSKHAWPATQLPEGLRGLNIVRYSAQGNLSAAISLSQEVDPTADLSGGGYWLHLSPDRGRTWRAPLYLGFAQYAPYVVVAHSKLPLVRGRTLQIEVEVKEIDIARLTSPGAGIPIRRQAKDLYIELSLDDIERDSDTDGLTDLLETKLRTNPRDADTDHDGIRDDQDPLPQASRTAKADKDADLIRTSLQKVFTYVGPNNLRAPVFFVQCDAKLLQGLDLPGRTVVVTPQDVRELKAQYGLFYPTRLDVLLNQARTLAVVVWSNGWSGGTFKFRLQ